MEFGRQCIPANLKPSFSEFEDYLRALSQRKDSMLTREETDASLVSFFAGIVSDGPSIDENLETFASAAATNLISPQQKAQRSVLGLFYFKLPAAEPCVFGL